MKKNDYKNNVNIYKPTDANALRTIAIMFHYDYHYPNSQK